MNSFTVINIQDRIKIFHQLGETLRHLTEDKFQSLAQAARDQNPWFTELNVRMAMDGIGKFLKQDVLEGWLSRYDFRDVTPKKIALVMAGNIPMAGFHDFLCVLISGHMAQIKLSSKDTVLMTFLIEQILAMEPLFQSKITLVERLKDFDGVIATGSDNSARYFNYYFGKYYHIIRKNRTSVAILDGSESDEELYKLGLDIFSYFGLGCRNISKIFVPQGYDFKTFFPALEPYQPIIHHHKYCNNYDYQKSILLVNREPFLDNGFVLLQESQKIVSPISIVYYEFYANQQEIKEKIKASEDKIQCIVGKYSPAVIPFGEAQYPTVDDYADRVDTIKFLISLH
jgi:hypothetical protein